MSMGICFLKSNLIAGVRDEAGEEEKRIHWTELEIRGPIKNLSPELWKLTHLTALFLNDNNLQVYVCTS